MAFRLARVPQNRYALVGAVVGATAIQCTICVVALLHAIGTQDPWLAIVSGGSLACAMVSLWWVAIANLLSKAPPESSALMWGPVSLHTAHTLATGAVLVRLMLQAISGP